MFEIKQELEALNIEIVVHDKSAEIYPWDYQLGDENFQEKDCIVVKATVSEHREYNSEPETYLNRVVLLQNLGSKK